MSDKGNPTLLSADAMIGLANMEQGHHPHAKHMYFTEELKIDTEAPVCLTGQCFLGSLLGFTCATLTARYIASTSIEPSNWVPVALLIGVSMGIMFFGSSDRVFMSWTKLPLVLASSAAGLLTYKVILSSIGSDTTNHHIGAAIFAACFGTLVVSISQYARWWRILCVESAWEATRNQSGAHMHWKAKMEKLVVATTEAVGCSCIKFQRPQKSHCHNGQRCCNNH